MQLSLSLLISVDLFSPSIYTGKYSIHYFCHVRSGSGSQLVLLLLNTWNQRPLQHRLQGTPRHPAILFFLHKMKVQGFHASSYELLLSSIPYTSYHESKTVSIFQPAPVMVLTDLGHFVLGQIPSLCVWMSADFTLFLNSKFFGHLDHVKLPT